MGGAGNDTLSDGGTAQLLVGGAGDDTLSATAASVLRGGAGSDTFIINQAMVTALQTPFGQPGNNGPYNASVDGGEGGINTVNTGGARQLDTLQLSGTGIVLDLTQIRNIGQMDPEINGRISGIEIIDLVDKSNSVKLTARDVLDMSDAVDLDLPGDFRQLVVRGPKGATVDLADSPDGRNPWVSGKRIVGAGWGEPTTWYQVFITPALKPMVLVQTDLIIV
jgi:Ca2+-binding RTX toxin-like protein